MQRMTGNEIIRIGNVQMHFSDALKLYNEKKYICTYSSIYQLSTYQANTERGYSIKGTQVIYWPKFELRGRWHARTAKEINKIIGTTILIEE